MNGVVFDGYITEEMVTKFCDVVNDNNPIHCGMGAIVPGMLLASLITKNPIPGIMVRDVSFKFIKPTPVNSKVTITYSMLNVRGRGDLEMADVEYVFTVNNETVATAIAKILRKNNRL